MAEYEIIYDYCGEEGGYVERNCCETFYGTWDELQQQLRCMKQRGTYFNIYASCVSDGDDW